MNWKTARKLVVLVVGGTIVLCGMAMIVLPGPAIVVIPVGIMILAGEFAWARRLYRRLRSFTEVAEPDRADEHEEPKEGSAHALRAEDSGGPKP